MFRIPQIRSRILGSQRLFKPCLMGFSSSSNVPPTEPVKTDGVFSSILEKLKMRSPTQIVGQPGYNRWLSVPAAVGTHISLGSIFAFSMLSPSMMNLQGVQASAANDWTLGEVMPIFSALMVSFGASSFMIGRLGLNEKLGPRVTGVLGGGLFASSFALASVAVSIHSYPLLFLSYGVAAGTTVGLSYVNPISTLIKWFPDKKGLASALAVMGFGAGGMVAAPLIQRCLSKYQKMPTYAGPLNMDTTQVNGVPHVNIDGVLQPVVAATQVALDKFGAAAASLQEGFYLVGTGSTGLSETFLTLGAIYGTAIFLSALAIRTPPEGYKGPLPMVQGVSLGTQAPDANIAPIVAELEKDYTPKEAAKTDAFKLLWVGMTLSSAGAYAMIGNAKPMLMDMFSSVHPDLLTTAFAAAFVSAVSFFNLSGRIAWGACADKIGTSKTMTALWGLSVPAYLCMPFAAHLGIPEGIMEYAPLGLFLTSCMLGISAFGGSAAVSPAYLADLFGRKYVAAIHGQLLSFLLVAGFLGPMLASTLTQKATEKAIYTLAEDISNEEFEKEFHCSKTELPQLIKNKTITIARLLRLRPNTADPTRFVHDKTLIALGVMQLGAFACNIMIRKGR